MLWVIKGRKRRKINDDMEQAFVDRGWKVYHMEQEPLPFEPEQTEPEPEQPKRLKRSNL